MYFRRLQVTVLAVSSLFVGCKQVPHYTLVRTKATAETRIMQPKKERTACTLRGIKLNRSQCTAFHHFMINLAFQKWLEGLSWSPPFPYSCVARVETNSNWSMVGSTYSTAYGVINDIIWQYGSPQEQARIFSGTSNAREETDMVSRFVAQHGWGGWGERTKAVCGL